MLKKHGCLNKVFSENLSHLFTTGKEKLNIPT